jgi:uncharacterized protein YhaN
VRIERVQVEGFGRLVGFDTGPESLGGLVVILGPNEAGKSTLFSFLTTALYGFQPATREANPHVPWGSAEASGRVRIRLAGGGCADVERKLRSQPSGRMTLGGLGTDLRNQAVPWVEHVPRGVFRQVFAVTLAELAGLDGETWARIQDKVVGSMGASDLRSARVVADTLEKEAGEIWRPSRRGNQRLRELQAEIRALRSRRTSAHDRDQKVRALVQEREAVQARLDAARVERHRVRAAVEHVQTLLPVKRQLERIASLRVEGGDRNTLAGMPSDPLARLSDLETKMEVVRSRRDTLAAELVENEAALAQFDDLARKMLERREHISRVVARAAGCVPDRGRARDLDAEIRDLEARLDVAAARLLAGPWRDQQEALAKLSVDVLRDRIARGAPLAVDAPERASPAILAVGFVVGSLLLAWGILGGGALLSALGGALVAVAGAGALSRTRRARRVTPSSARARPADGLALLEGVRLQPAHRGQLSEALVSGLAHLQGLLQERADRTRSLAATASRIDEADAEATLLARDLGLEDNSDGDAVALVLDSELRRAERGQEVAGQAQRESRRLNRERQASDAALATLTAAVAALRAVGATVSSGDPVRGLEQVRARLAAHRRADELEMELERSHPDLREIEGQIAASVTGFESHSLDADALARTRMRIDELEEEVEQLLRHAEALDQSATHLREIETVDAVDSEIAALRETEVSLARERDRKWVLARILREADRRFREEHQPDLLRRAGTYLAHLTGGRYERLIVDETDNGHLFHLVGPGLPAPVALASPVSTGTLEQAYLSLRLAIVDHLDRSGERLPLFVDEVFVNWDGERRARGIEVLASIAAKRQVFVFTCHPGVADELAQRGGRILALGQTG